MPELPEVENVRRSLITELPLPLRIRNVRIFRRDLRFGIPHDIESLLVEKELLKIDRRAKYLLFEFSKFSVLSHLGMSGSWRVERNPSHKKHDHIEITFDNDLKLIYHDPRRFGVFTSTTNVSEHKLIRNLGYEPLDQNLTSAKLMELASNKDVSVKNFLMNQSYVVGIGNIYVAEVLFKAGVLPTRKVRKVKAEEWRKILKFSQAILSKAIARGGTTINDYVNARNESGAFQDDLLVYDRKGKPCKKCKTPIRHKMQMGRSSYWCSQCQR